MALKDDPKHIEAVEKAYQRGVRDTNNRAIKLIRGIEVHHPSKDTVKFANGLMKTIATEIRSAQ